MLSEQFENNTQVSGHDEEITLGILKHVQNDNAMTQRSVAKDLGIAVGLANRYLKRCIRKGWIKVNQAPANRYMYYLTPGGFAEKSKLTRQFLYQSFNFFRYARLQCSEILEHCVARNWKRLALVGSGDLAEIMILHAKEYPVKLVAVVDADTERKKCGGVTVVNSIGELRRFDVVVLTDLNDPQGTYDQLTSDINEDRILLPELLDVVRSDHKPDLVGETGES